MGTVKPRIDLVVSKWARNLMNELLWIGTVKMGMALVLMFEQGIGDVILYKFE